MTDLMLIIEDELLFGSELQRHYQRMGWDVVWMQDLTSARQTLNEKQLNPLIVLSDMNLPDGNGLDLLEEMQKKQQYNEWIFLTGYGSVPDSVRALRVGAYDFLTKPCDQGRLDVVVAGAARSARAQRRIQEESSSRTKHFSLNAFIGRSKQALQAREMLQKLAQVPFSVLIITGETGTGKGLAAHILHHSGSRCSGPLVEINCAALPHELLESELFGHEAGAFTGAKGRRRGLMEQADGGTLFLDEISEINLELQAKLLKAIEERTVRRLGGNNEIHIDIQVIAATNQNLKQDVEKGRFRADLYHRLSVFQLELPALHTRREDIHDLVPHFINEYNIKAGKHIKRLSEEAWQKLTQHQWPGNVRELRNVIERCVLFSNDDLLPDQWLQLSPMPTSTAHMEGNKICLPLDGSMALDDMDRHIIETALERNRYNVTATARALGTTRETLRYRISKYKLKQRVSQGRE